MTYLSSRRSPGRVYTARVDEQSDLDSSDNDTSSSESEDSASSSESSSSESESEAEADAELMLIYLGQKKVKKEHSTITSSWKKKSKTRKSHKVKDIKTPPL